MRNTDRLSLQLIFAPLDLFVPCRLVGVVMVELLSLYDIKAEQMQPPISERNMAPLLFYSSALFHYEAAWNVGAGGWRGLSNILSCFSVCIISEMIH